MQHVAQSVLESLKKENLTLCDKWYTEAMKAHNRLELKKK